MNAEITCGACEGYIKGSEQPRKVEYDGIAPDYSTCAYGIPYKYSTNVTIDSATTTDIIIYQFSDVLISVIVEIQIENGV